VNIFVSIFKQRIIDCFITPHFFRNVNFP
jgi:hypothetical protein